jgi:hypothetical protein
MTQSIILPAAQTPAQATDVDVVPGVPATFQLFASSGRVPPNITLAVYSVVNNIEQPLGGLHIMVEGGRLVVGAGCKVRIKRPDISAFGVDVGVTVDQ